VYSINYPFNTDFNNQIILLPKKKVTNNTVRDRILATIVLTQPAAAVAAAVASPEETRVFPSKIQVIRSELVIKVCSMKALLLRFIS